MRDPKLEYSVTFEFILTGKQRADVEAALQHDDIAEVRWTPYVDRLEISIVVVELRLGLNALATAEAVTFVGRKLQCLDDSLSRQIPA